MARLSSLVVKAGALTFVVLVPTRYAIHLQLLGGVWILQTLPALVVSLYTRWLHRSALLGGWAAGMIAGTWMAAAGSFDTPIFRLRVLGLELPAYEALYALALNLLVAVVASAWLRGRERDGGAVGVASSARRRCRAAARSSSVGSR